MTITDDRSLVIFIRGGVFYFLFPDSICSLKSNFLGSVRTTKNYQVV
jgi:hypothetical protein